MKKEEKEKKEKKEINVKLYTAIVLITIFILVVMYMVMYSVNRYFSKDEANVVSESGSASTVIYSE